MFQSTHPRGVRRSNQNYIRVELQSFNPRTREGCDFAVVRWTFYLTSFNPRTREGCDLEKLICFCLQTVSIHAPARGATAYSKVH